MTVFGVNVREQGVRLGTDRSAFRCGDAPVRAGRDGVTKRVRNAAVTRRIARLISNRGGTAFKKAGEPGTSSLWLRRKAPKSGVWFAKLCVADLNADATLRGSSAVNKGMLSYRPDIDGLRAIAVLSVILFHAGVPFLPGGYVGVDVFFVISGFLISSIILHEVAQKRFSVATFYERRIRRIFPALYVMLAVVSGLACFVLLPSELREFGKGLLATSLFYSNFEFWLSLSYFAPAADTKPLLHTWSLCVEEQFYFVFPLVLWAIARLRRPVQLALLLAMAGLSFALSVKAVSNDAVTAFYLPHSRAWELLLGTFLALGAVPKIERAWLSNAVAFAGLLALTIAVARYGKHTPFPGLAAVLPCLGTAALIHTGDSQRTLVARALRHPVMVRIGLLSYALYLWHWPWLVLAERAAVRALYGWEIVCLLALTWLCASASLRWLEEPVRKKRWLVTRTQVFSFGSVLIAAGACLGIAMDRGEGLPWRVSPAVLALDRESQAATRRKTASHCNNGPASSRRCEVGVPGREPSFVVWGDSHAGAAAPGIAEAARRVQASGAVFSLAACTPLEGVRVRGIPAAPCRVFNERVRRFIEPRSISHVVLLARWSFSAHGTRFKHERGPQRWLLEGSSKKVSPARNLALLRKGLTGTVEFLQSHGKHVSIVAGVPEVGFHVSQSLARLLWWHRALDIRPTLQETLARQRPVNELLTSLQRTHHVNIAYPMSILCGADSCDVERDEQPLYFDEDHLSRHGALVLSRMFERVLRSDRS